MSLSFAAGELRLSVASVGAAGFNGDPARYPTTEVYLMEFSRVTSPRRGLAWCLWCACWISLLCPFVAWSASGDALFQATFPGLAPQGITHDPTDNSFWVTSALDNEIRRFNSQLQLIESFPDPFPLSDAATGIAYYPVNDSLIVVEPTTFELLEIDKTGLPIGLGFFLNIQPVPNPVGGPFLRGMAFYPNGDGGLGSLFIVESVGTLIYEFDLQGNVLQTFVHPDDPDGFPGGGLAAQAGGIELVLDGTGTLIGFDLVSSVNNAPVILRLDEFGAPTGGVITPTGLTGGIGAMGGIVRANYIDPMGNPFDALYGTLESGPDLFVIDGTLPPIAELIDLTCSSTPTTITLDWTTGQTYDSILITRNGDPYQALPGTALTFTDAALADGLYTYEVFGVAGTLTTERLSCTEVIGAGRVQDILEIDTVLSVDFAVDLTEDSFGDLWITDSSNLLHAFDKNLNYLTSIIGPFGGPDDFMSGIAFRPDTGNFLVSNAFDSTIQEIDFAGTPIGAPFVAQIPMPPDEEPFLGGMIYNPDGNAGTGSLHVVEGTRSIVYELALDGSVLSSFVHPDEVQVPTPLDSFFDNFAHGISAVPEVGTGFDEIDLTAGTIYERTMTRIVRVDSATGAPTGFQMPTDAILNVNPVRFLAHHNTTFNSQPVSYVITIRNNDNFLLRVDRSLSAIPSLTYLTCRQLDLVDEVTIEFNNHGPYDSINVLRDGTFLTSLPGNATSFVDTTAAPGIRRYQLIPLVGGNAAETRECSLRVGPGAILRRELMWPAVSPYQMTRNPVDGGFFVTTNSPTVADIVYRFDSNLQFTGTYPGPVESPNQVAAMAVRPVGASFELYSIGWEVRTPFMQPQTFIFTVQDDQGTEILGPQVLNIPGPDPTVAVTYPCAMAYDSNTDTLWFLERNTDTFWNLDLQGNLLTSIPHPEPPAQDFVFNLGLAFDANRNAFTATTANFADLIITKTVGFTPAGVRIGEEIPLDTANINPLYGMARDNARMWVCGSVGTISQLLEVKAADGLSAPTNVDCSESAPNEVTIQWTEPVAYPEVVVRRDGVAIATVPGNTLQFVDTGVGLGPRAYSVAARDGSQESGPSACSLVVTGGAGDFIRGDASGDGNVDIADAVYILAYLFSNGPDPSCFDAADVDDDGVVNIADAISLLGFLFGTGLQPPQPYPTPGGDPTFDALGC